MRVVSDVGAHSAGATEESLYRLSHWAAKNVVDCFDGKLNPDNVVDREVLSYRPGPNGYSTMP